MRYNNFSQSDAAAVEALQSLSIGPDSVESYGPDPRQRIEWFGTGRMICFLPDGFDGAVAASRPAALALAEQGYTVGLVSYRFEPGAPELAAQDMAVLSAKPTLDTATWVGHGIGGSIVMNAVLHPELRTDHAVLLAPIVDFAQSARDVPDGVVTGLLGGTPEELPERFATFDPLFNYYQLGPAQYSSRELSIQIIHGMDDAVVSPNTVSALAGEPFSVATVEGAGHVDLIRPDHDAWVLVLGAVSGSAR